MSLHSCISPYARLPGKSVKDVMTPSPVTVRPSSNLDDVTGILLTRKIRRLPVVSPGGVVCGNQQRFSHAACCTNATALPAAAAASFEECTSFALVPRVHAPRLTTRESSWA